MTSFHLQGDKLEYTAHDKNAVAFDGCLKNRLIPPESLIIKLCLYG